MDVEQKAEHEAQHDSLRPPVADASVADCALPTEVASMSDDEEERRLDALRRVRSTHTGAEFESGEVYAR